MYSENVTVKELLEERLGPAGAQGVVDTVNNSYRSGIRGSDLQARYQDAVKKEGMNVPSDPGDILYGFIFI